MAKSRSAQRNGALGAPSSAGSPGGCQAPHRPGAQLQSLRREGLAYTQPVLVPPARPYPRLLAVLLLTLWASPGRVRAATPLLPTPPIAALSVREVLALPPDKVHALPQAARTELRSRLDLAARSQRGGEPVKLPPVPGSYAPLMGQLRGVLALDQKRQQQNQPPIVVGALLGPLLRPLPCGGLFDGAPSRPGLVDASVGVPPGLGLDPPAARALRLLLSRAAAGSPELLTGASVLPMPGMPAAVLLAKSDRTVYVNPVVLELLRDEPSAALPATDLRTPLPDGTHFPPPDLYREPEGVPGSSRGPACASAGCGCLEPWNQLCADSSRSCQRCDRDCTRSCASCSQCSSDCGQCSSDCNRCSSDCNRCSSDCNRCSSDCNQCNRQCSQCGSQCNQCNGPCNQCRVGAGSLLALPMPPGPAPEPGAGIRFLLGARGSVAFMLPPILFLWWRRRLSRRTPPEAVADHEQEPA